MGRYRNIIQIWRIGKNRELYEMYDEPDIAKFKKLGRLGWVGHVARREEQAIPRNVLEELEDRD